MSTTLVDNNGTKLIHCQRASDNFTAVLVPKTLTTAAANSTFTPQDVTFIRTADWTESLYDLDLTIPSGSPNPPTVTNHSTGVITFDSAGNGTRISNGNVNLTIASTQKTIKLSGTVTTSQPAAFDSFANGSLGKHLLDSLTTILSGQTAPTFTPIVSNGTPIGYTASSALCDIYNANGTRNASGWWGSIDLTAIPAQSGIGGRNGILVTPRDMLFADHTQVGGDPSSYPPAEPSGTTFVPGDVTFDDNSGNHYNRSIAAFRNISGTDIRVITLDADLPSSIKPLQLIPSSYAVKLPSGSYGYACVFTNQDRRLLVGQSTSFNDSGISFSVPSNTTLSPWFYPIRANDSGSPTMLLINNVLVQIMNIFHSIIDGGEGPNDGTNFDAINTAIAANVAALGNGTPYTVCPVDLSGFASY